MAGLRYLRVGCLFDVAAVDLSIKINITAVEYL